MNAWEKLKLKSSIQTGTAWEHLSSQISIGDGSRLIENIDVELEERIVDIEIQNTDFEIEISEDKIEIEVDENIIEIEVD